MMCLGWKTKASCKTRGEVQVTPPADSCPNITWFWLALGAIGIGAIAQGSKEAK